MTVTVYLEGPTKASRRLSSLTTRVLALGWASWHTTLAASITGAAGQLREGVLKADINLPTTVKSGKTPRAPGTARISWGFPEPGETPPSDHLAGPSYGDHGRGRYPWVGQTSASLVLRLFTSSWAGVGTHHY